MPMSMSFLGVIVIIALVIIFLKESEVGKYVLIAVVAALACLLMYLVTGLSIMIALAKLCGVIVILIAAFIVIRSIL